jgi:hypothetical protein
MTVQYRTENLASEMESSPVGHVALVTGVVAGCSHAFGVCAGSS